MQHVCHIARFQENVQQEIKKFELRNFQFRGIFIEILTKGRSNWQF